MARRNNPMAPYFVQMREFERQLILGAIEAGGNITAAADLLGVQRQYMKVRGKFLGGVFNDEPKHEPPDLAAKSWNAVQNKGAR